MIFYSLVAGFSLPLFIYAMEISNSSPGFKKIILPSTIGFGCLSFGFSWYKSKKLENRLDIKYTPIWLKLSKR